MWMKKNHLFEILRKVVNILVNIILFEGRIQFSSFGIRLGDSLSLLSKRVTWNCLCTWAEYLTSIGWFDETGENRMAFKRMSVYVVVGLTTKNIGWIFAAFRLSTSCTNMKNFVYIYFMRARFSRFIVCDRIRFKRYTHRICSSSFLFFRFFAFSLFRTHSHFRILRAKTQTKPLIPNHKVKQLSKLNAIFG